MKKNWIRLFACAISAACVLSLSACGSNDAESSAVSAADSSAIIGGADSETSIVVANADAPYANVEEMLADETVASTMEESLSAMESEGLSMAIKGEGNRLVYTFTYESLDETADLEQMSSALEEAMGEMGATFETIAGSLADTVQEANPTVVVVYQTADGTELYSGEFSAE